MAFCRRVTGFTMNRERVLSTPRLAPSNLRAPAMNRLSPAPISPLPAKTFWPR